MSENSQSFLIVTDLGHADWQRAAEYRWSDEHDLMYDLLVANVTIVVNGLLFLPKTGLAIAGFALGLGEVLKEVTESRSGSATSIELCGDFYIEFAWDSEQISLEHSFAGRPAAATISRDAFWCGATAFLTAFVLKGTDTIPAFLGWGEMKALEQYWPRQLDSSVM